MNGAVAFVLKAVLGIDTSEYEKGLDDAKGKASSAGSVIGNGLKTIGKVGAVAISAASAAVEAFAISSVKTGAEFDKSMSQVAATMGFTVTQLNATEEQLASMTEEERNAAIAAQESFGQLREYAQEMGRTTAFSASQASDALNYMALAGYDVETSMAMLPNVLNLAASGNMELARASDMVTDAATAFGLVLEDGSVDIERTTQMVDEMAKAASTGNTSVEQLGDAFLVVGGLAQEMNGGMVELSDGTTATYDNIQELEIALTAMANAGIKGSEAGTHMRNMLLKLASPTKEGIEAFENLGVSVFDSEGKMRSLAYIMEDLDVALGELTQQEKLQAISDIFNTRDTAAAEALLNAVGEDWGNIAESILDADGAAQKMADTQLDNLAGDITLFQSALEGAKIAVSDQLTPSLREFVQFGTDGLSRLTDAFQEGGITGAMAEFGTILSDGIAMVTKMLPEAINAGMELLGAVGQGIIQNLPVIIDAAVDIVEQLANGLVTALPALADGALQIIVGLADGIARMLPTLIPTIVDVVMQIVDTLIDNVPLLVDGAVQLILGLAEGLINAIPVLTERLPEIITSIVEALVKSIPLLVDGAIQLIQGIIDALPTIIEALITAIPQLIDAYVNGLITYLPVLIDGVIQLVVALAQAMPQIIEALVAAIPTIIQTITDALITNLPQLIEGLIQMNIALVAALPQIISALIEAIPQILSMIVEALITSAPMIFEAVVSILATVVTTLLEYGANFISTVGEIMSNMLNTAIQWLSQLPTQMAYWAGFAIGSFIKFVAELPGKLQTILTDVIARVIAFGTNFKNKAIEMARNFFNSIVNGLAQLPSRVADLGNQLVQAVANLPSRFMEIGSNIVSGIWNGISSGWSWLTSRVSDLAHSLLQGAKDALGIASPSKEFAWVGRMVDEGFAQGIGKFDYLVTDALDSLTTIPDINVGANVKTSDIPSANTGTNNVIMNIYGAVGQDENELADIISKRINDVTGRRMIAMGVM